MKKITILMFLLVLTISVLAGCGCRNSKPAQTIPTTLPTVVTEPATEMTTLPTTIATEPTDNTIQDGNGPISTDITSTTDEADTNNARSRTNGTGSGNGITGSITG